MIVYEQGELEPLYRDNGHFQDVMAWWSEHDVDPAIVVRRHVEIGPDGSVIYRAFVLNEAGQRVLHESGDRFKVTGPRVIKPKREYPL